MSRGHCACNARDLLPTPVTQIKQKTPAESLLKTRVFEKTVHSSGARVVGRAAASGGGVFYLWFGGVLLPARRPSSRSTTSTLIGTASGQPGLSIGPKIL